MAGIAFRNIVKSFAGGEFNGFSLDIDAGEFVTLAGEKDCGARELIKMAAGQSRRYEGMITVNDRRMTMLERRDSGACLITSQPLFGTPRRQMRAALSLEGKADAEARINEAAEITGITEILDTSLRKLSNEKLLRAGLAVAIAMNAKVALMDDPLSGMPARDGGMLGIWLRDMHARTGMTFLAAVTNPVQALSLATRVVVIKNGAIAQSNTPQNIYDFPANSYVARYFGSTPINLIPAKLTREGDDVFVEFGAAKINVPAGKLNKLIDKRYIGGEVTLGVRPENIHYEGAFISISPGSVVDFEIKQVELLGEATYLHARLEGLDEDIMARVDPRCIAAPGDTLTMAIDSNRLHFFDAETGESILSRI